MESIYAALILHKVGKKIDEDSIGKILKAAGADVDSGQVKALVKATGSMNLDEVIKGAAVAAPAAAAPAAAGGASEKKEGKKNKIRFFSTGDFLEKKQKSMRDQ